MRNRLEFACVVVLIFLAGAVGAANADISLPDELIALEEQGIDPVQTSNFGREGSESRDVILLDSLPDTDVLLVPNSTSKSVGIYDPFSGDFLGIFVQDTALFTTPICAMLGPDGNIYLSDQVEDAVFVYDKQGNYIMTYADATDGLDNVRGIDFRGGHLFVTSGDDYVAEFSGPHTRLPDFIADGSEPFDIFFLEDGRSLLADIYGSTDNVRLYNADGTFAGQIFAVSFPEQIQADLLDGASYLNIAFSANVINDFQLNGTIEQTTSLSGGRGIYRLGNGNYLATNGAGVHEVTPGGGIIRTITTGSGRFIELYSPTPSGDASEIDLSRTSFTETVAEGGTLNLDLYISNLGTAELIFGMSVDQIWISCAPDTGNIAAAGVDTVVVTLDAGSLTPGTYTGQIIVTSTDPDEGSTALPVSLLVTGGGGGCVYLPGDINGNGTTNGIDVGYGVNYFKGGPVPPIRCDMCPQPAPFFAGGDVNGNCVFNGIDVTFFVNYLKGIVPALLYCPSCPPSM